MIPEALRLHLESVLGGTPAEARPATGSGLSQTSRVVMGGRSFFLKWGDGAIARTYAAEADGLALLRAAAGAPAVPEVYAHEGPASGIPGYLLLEWVEPGRPGSVFWEAFGRALAALHRCTHPRYGLDADNYIGRTPQRNTPGDDWAEFFAEYRIEAQVRLARQRGVWNPAWDRSVGRVMERLPALLPASPEASLLHGDLWRGNYLVAPGGGPVLIDPAVYFGHRETDLAMTELFGGFPERFYASYREAWALDAGYEERRDLYNLYHLLNHLNLFGSSYADAIARTLRRYA